LTHFIRRPPRTDFHQIWKTFLSLTTSILTNCMTICSTVSLYGGSNIPFSPIGKVMSPLSDSAACNTWFVCSSSNITNKRNNKKAIYGHDYYNVSLYASISEMTCTVSSGTINPSIPYHPSIYADIKIIIHLYPVIVELLLLFRFWSEHAAITHYSITFALLAYQSLQRNQKNV